MYLKNRYALSYMTLSIEFIFVIESFFGELRIVSDLVLTDWFFFLFFMIYLCFYFSRTFFAFKASKKKNYTSERWEGVHDYISYYIRKTYVTCVRSHCKPLKKEYAKYWLNRQFDKKLNFRYRLYINVVSYTYILMYIIAIFIFLFSNIFMYYLDFPALIVYVRVFIGDRFLHIILCCFLYRLFLSYIFPNIKLRYFIRFHSVLTGYCCGIVDTYTMLNSFMMYKMIAGKRHWVEHNFLFYSSGLLGMKKYLVRFFGRRANKYWFTLENNKAVYKRYFIPVAWSHYKSIEMDELVDTPYFRFKRWLSKWKYLILTKSVKPYLLKQKSRVIDHEFVELNRYYEPNLKRNYTYKR